MGRPKKDAGASLNHTLTFRVTGKELERIDDRARGAALSRSDYLRKMALTGKVTVKQSKADFQLLHELNKIGVNLNQLVHGAHIHGRIPDTIPALCQKIEELITKATEEEEPL